MMPSSTIRDNNKHSECQKWAELQLHLIWVDEQMNN